MVLRFFVLIYLVYGVHTQICGPGIYPGPIPYEQCGPCGPQPIAITQIPQQIFPGPCAQQQIIAAPNFIAQPCGNGIPPCGNIIPPCGNGIPSCGNVIPPCGNSIPQCINSLPPCVNIPQYPNFIPQTLAPSLIANQAPCAPIIPQIPNLQTCGTSPVVSTTVVDNTLANSLANAIQLLIVSNLIENTLGSCGSLSSPCGSLSYNGICDSVSPCISNLFELVSTDFSPSYCDYFEPYSPVIEVPCVEQVVTYSSPCIDTCYTPNYGPVVNTLVEAPCNYGLSAGLGGSNFGCLDNCVGTLAPVAAEVMFPSSIPAQLTCNFGYMASNVPVVSVNVEPLPFDCSCGYGNGFYY